MTTPKLTQSSTALVRVLALPIMVGALAGCDYASKLPDAPGSLGSYDISQKPPSVTGRGEATRLPPPPADAFSRLKAPVEDRIANAVQAPVNQAVANAEAFTSSPENSLSLPGAGGVAPIDTPPLPIPTGQAAQAEQVAFAPLEFENIGQSAEPVLQPEPIAPTVVANDFAAPLDVAAQTYAPISADAPAYTTAETPAYQSYESAPLDTYSVAGTVAQPEVSSYEPAPIQTEAYSIPAIETFAQAPVETYSISAPPPAPIETYSAPAATNFSPLTVLRSRLPNGAVVNVHPVIGAPGGASAVLARTVVSTIGTPVDEETARNAAVSYNLRGRAERNTEDYVSVEWTLVDAGKNVIGVFPERQDGGNWKEMNDTALRALGQRVADRIARNGALRQSTLYTAANTVYDATQSIQYETVQAQPNSTFVLTKGATLAEAPLPRISPRTATTYSAPIEIATRPVQAISQPISQPISTQSVTQAPIRAAVPSPAPVRVTPLAPQVVTQAPRPVAPPPAFDTLRPQNAQQPVSAPAVVASGPRPLVFRGVQGAPGDGDQALGREVGKLLAQSGARVTTTPEPGALFLTARVSKTPGANSDRIAIVWEVQDANGANVGQVTQENEVPRGLLDNAWGEDAYYAAEGARDGIMELLQGVGALES